MSHRGRTAGQDFEEADLALESPPVGRAALIHTWSHLSFLHWPYDPAAVQAVLPPGLAIDTFDGRAWVGLVPFTVTIRPPFVPPLPWVNTFDEVNVRTYVIGPDGRRGVWFLSLDAGRVGAVVVARATYRLNYLWARTRFCRTDDLIRYEVRRRWPGHPPVTSRLTLRVGEPCETDALARFLTARWRFYCGWRQLGWGDVEHEPWPLHRVRVVDWHDELIAALGLPLPEGEPIAHHSRRVHVRMSAPHWVQDGATAVPPR